MSLVEQRPEGILAIRGVRDDCIRVEARDIDHSFLIAPDGLHAWAPGSVDAVDEAAIDAILALEPELVIFGSGPRQRFLPPRLQARLLQRGVGVESMDNAAAARTFNLLAQEGRRVIGAFLLGG